MAGGGVSILVFLELALGRPTDQGAESLSTVSILVFLELALGQRSEEDTDEDADCVSILVFLELALGLNVSNEAEFQSLFSWNLPSDIEC